MSVKLEVKKAKKNFKESKSNQKVHLRIRKRTTTRLLTGRSPNWGGFTVQTFKN